MKLTDTKIRKTKPDSENGLGGTHNGSENSLINKLIAI